MKILNIYHQNSKLNTYVAFEIKIFENNNYKFQHYLSILKIIYINFTYWLYVIFDFINRSINYRNNNEHIRIIMIIVNYHFIVHFCFSNSSNKIFFIDKNKWIWMFNRTFFFLIDYVKFIVVFFVIVIKIKRTISRFC